MLVITLALLLAGCAGGPGVDLKETKVYPKAPAAPFVPQDYLIGPGDQLEVLYHIDPGAKVHEYYIDTEDTLRVDFFYYPIMSRTVKVRPDGYVTLPRVGDVKAAGHRPSDVTKNLQEMYKPYLNRPDLTVEVIDFNQKVEKLKQAITTYARGQSREVFVRPDGKISLPYIRDVQAAGRSPEHLARVIDVEYAKYISNVMTTVAVLEARSNRVYVMGQVRNPAFYQLIGPTTLSQIIAQAGGFADYAKTDQILVISRDKEGQPMGKIVDTKANISQGNVAGDVYLNQYDVVFVPMTALGRAALTADALWRLIPNQFSFTVGGTYSMGGYAARTPAGSTTTTTTPTPTPPSQ